MKQLSRPSALLGALATCAILILASSKSVARDGPPGLEVGTKLYRVDFVRPAHQLFPGWVETSPVEVTGISGSWIALEGSVIPRGPVWINFDQVIHYQIRDRR